MKNHFLLIITLLTGSGMAQNIFPSSGKSGVNTTSPTEALHVIGNVRVDSSMTVKDSLNIQGRTRTFELIVQGNSKFIGEVVMKSLLKIDGNVKAKANLDVDGETKMTGNAKAMSDFIVNGLTKLNGNVKMDGLSEILIDSTLNFIVQLPNGQLKKMPILPFLYALVPPAELQLCFEDEFGDIPNPEWFSGLNKLFTDCDQVNVGIGTNEPEFKLDCRGTTYTMRIKIGSVSASEIALINGFVINNTQNLIALGKKVGASAEEVKFLISNDGAVELTNTGNVASLTINNGGGSAVKVFSEEGNNILELLNNGTLVLRSQSGPLFSMFSSDGSQILRLEDSGQLRARHIKVDMSTWADHVFGENYVLMPLREVESYIQSNHKLPGIPSESELDEKGLDLGEMQKLQMQKIEELTLHVIQMSKRVEELEDEVLELKSKK